MRAISGLKITTTNYHLLFKRAVEVVLLIRAAFNGDEKDVVLGFRLKKGKKGEIVSNDFWFEPRIPASKINSDFNMSRRSPAKCATVAGPINHLIEEWVNSQGARDEKAAIVLERLTKAHLSKALTHVCFEPLSFGENGEIDVFINYRKLILSTRIPMSEIADLVEETCLCGECG